jgi:hypothetical protein
MNLGQEVGGIIGGHNPFGRTVTILQAENGVIVSTDHQTEVEVPNMLGHPEDEAWKGTPQGQKIPTQLTKTHVFIDLKKALKFIEDYLEGKNDDGNS